MRILAYTSPARGHLYPCTPILLELRERGHDVHVRTLAGQVDALRELDLEAAAIDPAIEAIEHDDWRAKTPIGGLKRAVATFSARARHDLADLQRAIVDVEPDVLLVDVMAWGANAAAAGSGLPWASFNPTFIPWAAPGVPPFGPGLAPRTDRFGTLRDAAVTRLSPPFPGLDCINALRATAGAAPLADWRDYWVAAPRVIGLTAEPFEYPRVWPANVRLVGPTMWEPPADPPAWLADDERPLIVVTASSEFQGDGRRIAVALKALRDEPVRVVATSAAVDPAAFDVPANARVERFLPHGPLIERAACVVSHGGMGITQKALAAGVPQCVAPFGRDQMESARRVEVCGAGTRIMPNRASPERLRAKVRAAMTCKPGAERIAAAFARAGGAPAAADAVEALAGLARTGTP